MQRETRATRKVIGVIDQSNAQKHDSGAHSDNYVANTSGVNLVFYAITAKENAVVFNSRVGACIIRIRWIRVARLSSALACINRRCKMKEKRGKVQRLQKILVHHL